MMKMQRASFPLARNLLDVFVTIAKMKASLASSHLACNKNFVLDGDDTRCIFIMHAILKFLMVQQIVQMPVPRCNNANLQLTLFARKSKCQFVSLQDVGRCMIYHLVSVCFGSKMLDPKDPYVRPLALIPQ